MFPMTVTINTAAELNAILAAINPDTAFPGTSDSRTIQQVDAEIKQANTKTAKAEQPKEEAKPEPKAEPAKEEKTEAMTQMNAAEATEALNGHANRPVDAPTYQDVTAAINAVAKAKGRDAAVAVLAKFGVKRGPELTPEQYADAIVACKEAAE